MSGKRIKLSSNRVKFEISPVKIPKQLQKFGIDKDTKFKLKAWTMDSVCGKSSLVNWAVKKNDFKHLKDLKMPHVNSDESIDIVLGTDFPGLLAVLESRIGAKLSEPIAHLTRIGWVCLGPSEKKRKRDCDDMSALSFRAEECVPDERLDMLVRSFWEESQVPGPIFGKATDPDDARSRDEGKFQARNRKFPSEENTEAYRKMEITHDEKEGIYTAKIPWRNQTPDLKTNRSEVLKRQLSTVEPKYLRRKGIQMSDLIEIIKEYEGKGYIRRMDEKEIREDSWYLPWFPVVDKGSATTKIRIVFDGASRFGGKSLNMEAMTGPNLLIPYLQILFRFRKFQFCFVGDSRNVLEDSSRSYGSKIP
jgi:hypothetical protein